MQSAGGVPQGAPLGFSARRRTAERPLLFLCPCPLTCRSPGANNPMRSEEARRPVGPERAGRRQESQASVVALSPRATTAKSRMGPRRPRPAHFLRCGTLHFASRSSNERGDRGDPWPLCPPRARSLVSSASVCVKTKGGMVTLLRDHARLGLVDRLPPDMAQEALSCLSGCMATQQRGHATRSD